jgi:RNA polymerase sigma factor (sigma-70 family)
VSAQQNETYLISELVKGNQQAFEELYYMYAAAIQSNISKWIKDQETVHDLLQEVFIALWENRQTIDPHKGVAPWLYTVSYNKGIKFLRKKIKEVTSSDAVIDLSLFADEQDADQTHEDANLSVIHEALDRLPERKKTAFLEYKLKGKSLDQVAAEMGITKETVKGYLKDARKFILQYVAASQPPASIATILFFLWLTCL